MQEKTLFMILRLERLMSTTNPLLLTLSLNTEAQLYFNQLRALHFPANRNYLQAHLMLFHQLPAHEQGIINDIASTVQHLGIFPLEITKVVGIGRGVAYKAESAVLMDLHRQLQRQWLPWLIPQDTQKLWPHITVQNKVEPDAAKILATELSAGFRPFLAYGTGLTLWEYRQGPWEFIQQFDFKLRSS